MPYTTSQITDPLLYSKLSEDAAAAEKWERSVYENKFSRPERLGLSDGALLPLKGQYGRSYHWDVECVVGIT